MRIQLEEKYKEREGDLGSNPGPGDYQYYALPTAPTTRFDYIIGNK